MICLLFPSIAYSRQEETARIIHSRLKNEDIKTWKTTASKYIQNNSLDSALVCYSYIAQSTAQGAQYENKADYAAALNGLGVVYFLYGNYHQAYAMFSNAVKENPEYVDAYQNLASIYWLFGQYDRSVNQLDRAFRMQFDHGTENNALAAYVNMINILIQHGSLKNVNNFINTFNSYKKTLDTPMLKYAESLNKGASAIAKGHPEEAVIYFKESYKLFPDIDPRLGISMRQNIAKAFNLIQENDSALKYHVDALDIATKYNYDDMQIEAGKNVADQLDKMGLHDKAKEYRYNAWQLSDSISNFLEYSKIMDMEYQSEMDSYRDKLEKNDSERKRYYTAFVIISIIAVIFAIMILILLRQRNLLNLKDRKLFNQIFQKSMLNAEDNHAVINEGGKEKSAESRKMESTERDKTPGSAYKNKIDPKREELLEVQIKKTMSDEKHILSPDFSLTILANLVGDTVKNVSQVINDKFNKNFATFLNEKRVKAALKKLNNPDYDKFTLDVIAEELGFKSRSHFSKVFSMITGISPSSYRKFRNKPADDVTDEFSSHTGSTPLPSSDIVGG